MVSRRRRRHGEPELAQLPHPGLRRRAAHRGVLRRHLRHDRPARRQVAGRVRASIRSRRRSPTRWPTPPACASRICPSRRTASSPSSRPGHERGPDILRPRGARHHRHADAGAAGGAEAFAAWQDETSKAIAAFPGFIEQSVMPPNPPLQVDWVILQRFASQSAAVAWLNSAERLTRIETRAPDAGRPRRRAHRQGRSGRRAARPGLGRDLDAHQAGPGGRLPRLGAADRRRPDARRRASRATASSRRSRASRRTGCRSCASTARPTCRPGSNRRSARRSSRRPTPSPRNSTPGSVRTGFDQWFRAAPGGGAPPAGLEAEHDRPAAALSDRLPVRRPRADAAADAPAGPAVPGRPVHRQCGERRAAELLVPWTSTRFAWWLRPAAPASVLRAVGGAVLVVLLYGVLVLAFTRLS